MLDRDQRFANITDNVYCADMTLFLYTRWINWLELQTLYITGEINTPVRVQLSKKKETRNNKQLSGDKDIKYLYIYLYIMIYIYKCVMFDRGIKVKLQYSAITKDLF